MRPWLYGLWLDEAGQDLVEYTLLVAGLLLVVFAITGTGQQPIRAIWHIVGADLDRGIASASGRG